MRQVWRDVCSWFSEHWTVIRKWGVLAFAGAGFTLIQVDEYLFACVCWIAASAAWASLAWKPQRWPARALYIFTAACFLVVMIRWTVAKRGEKPWSVFLPRASHATEAAKSPTSPKDPAFRVVLRYILHGGTKGDFTPYIVRSGNRLYRTNLACYLEVTNLQPRISTIERFSAEVNGPDIGEWIPLVWIKTTSGTEVGVPPRGTIWKRVKIAGLEDLGAQFTSLQSMKPGQTFRGWLFFARTDNLRLPDSERSLRVHVEDKAGQTNTIVVHRAPSAKDVIDSVLRIRVVEIKDYSALTVVLPENR